MTKYKIICGPVKECEIALNKYAETHWIIIHGMSADKGLTTIIIELTERT